MSKHAGRPVRTQTPALRRRHSGWYMLTVIAVLSVAAWLLWPSLAGKFAPQQSGAVLALDAAMDGFSVQQIKAKVGEPLTVQLRSLDTPYHSDGGGKHQFAIDEFGVNIVAPPKGVSAATFTPDKPGTYTFYGDICCGGKANPTMQGTLVVTA